MAVFPNLKKVFIHIPRTGGTSVSLALNTLDKALPEDFKHYDCRYYESKYDILEYQRFAVVRNPYTRLISYYNYHDNVDMNVVAELNKYPNIKDRFLKYLELNLTTVPFTYGRIKPLLLYKRQIEYVDNNTTLLRFESLNDDLIMYLNHEFELPHWKGYDSKEKYTMEDLFSTDAIQIINEYFAIDFRELNYDKRCNI
jgi:hypothetical protein